MLLSIYASPVVPKHLSFVSSTTRKSSPPCTSAEVVEFQAFDVLHLTSSPTDTGSPTETGWQQVQTWYGCFQK